MRNIKRIILIIILIVTSVVLLLVGNGYNMYKEALEENSLSEKISKIKSK